MKNIIPQPGQKVSVYFKNGVTAQGIVVEWSNGKSILKSPHNCNLLLIHNTIQNIQMVYVELEAQRPGAPVTASFRPEPQSNLINKKQEKYNNHEQKYNDDALRNDKSYYRSLRTKKIIELQKIKADEEKKQAVETATSFDLNKGAPIEYAKPSILFKQHSRKKNT